MEFYHLNKFQQNIYLFNSYNYNIIQLQELCAKNCGSFVQAYCSFMLTESTISGYLKALADSWCSYDAYSSGDSDLKLK